MPKVKDIMTKNVVSISVNNSVFEAAETHEFQSDGLLGDYDGEVPIGIVTERDIVEGSWQKNYRLKPRSRRLCLGRSLQLILMLRLKRQLG